MSGKIISIIEKISKKSYVDPAKISRKNRNKTINENKNLEKPLKKRYLLVRWKFQSSVGKNIIHSEEFEPYKTLKYNVVLDQYKKSGRKHYVHWPIYL